MQHDFKIIVIGGSAGSFPLVCRILQELRSDFTIPIIMTLHRLKHVPKGFKEALALKSKFEVIEPDDKESVRSGKVYVAPANYHLCIELGNSFSLSTEPMINNSRPAIDLTFETASFVYKEACLGILLSGANKDGAKGMKKINERGGYTIVQNFDECVIDTMPKAACSLSKIDEVLSIEKIIEFLNNLK